MDVSRGNTGNILWTLTFLQLQEATKNFRPDMHIGEGGSAHVFKGKFPTGQDVAVKQLKPASDRNTYDEVEVQMLSRLSHPNIINLIGFCAEGDERIIVYEFMPLGSLYDHLHDIDEARDLWITYINEHKYQNLVKDMEDVEDDYA